MVSRRAVITGTLSGAALIGVAAGGVALAADGVIPGQARVDRALGYCSVTRPPVHATPGPIVTGSFASSYRHADVGYRIAYPPGHRAGDRLPVALLLHGFAENSATVLDAGNYPAYLAAAVNAGTRPFALAAPDGGNGYWHPHPGDDPLGMLVHEFLPLLGAHGLSIARPAVTGISMGGYGALLTGLTLPDRFAAVVANSPAFWSSYEQARHVNAGAFGSAADWDDYGNLLGRSASIAKLHVRIFIGSSDPFEPIVSRLRRSLPDPSVVRVSKGCHDGTFWQAHATDTITALGTALSRA
ncbi:MAG TPA: alpha/beta hydrolase-fold protein [Micromonosporaceae bacterium]